MAGEEGRAVKCSSRDLPFLLGKSMVRNENGRRIGEDGGDSGGIQWGGESL